MKGSLQQMNLFRLRNCSSLQHFLGHVDYMKFSWCVLEILGHIEAFHLAEICSSPQCIFIHRAFLLALLYCFMKQNLLVIPQVQFSTRCSMLWHFTELHQSNATVCWRARLDANQPTGRRPSCPLTVFGGPAEHVQLRCMKYEGGTLQRHHLCNPLT